MFLYIFLCGLFILNCQGESNGAWRLEFDGTENCKDSNLVFAMKYTDKCVLVDKDSSLRYKCGNESVDLLFYMLDKDCDSSDPHVQDVDDSYVCEKDEKVDDVSHIHVCVDDYVPNLYSNHHFQIPLIPPRKDVGSKDNPIVFDYYYPLVDCHEIRGDRKIYVTNNCSVEDQNGVVKVYKDSGCDGNPENQLNMKIGDVVDVADIFTSDSVHIYWKYVGCFETN